MPARISRAAYADMYGPTTGDRVRLADTELVIEVERDLTTYGEEVKFGGGKVIRDGMGQSQATARRGRRRHGDHQRADRRLDRASTRPTSGCRTAGSPRSARRATPTPSRASTIVIGPGTEVIAGEGRILTAGGFDSAHPLHLPAADRRRAALGPDDHARRRHRPGARHARHHLHAGAVAHRADAAGDRRRADEHRPLRQGQRLAAGGAARRWCGPAPAR